MLTWKLLRFTPFGGLVLIVAIGLWWFNRGKPAATPEEAVQNFLEAVREGNPGALLDTIARQPRGEVKEFLLQVRAVAKAQESLDKALDDTFGKSPNPAPNYEEQVKAWLLENFGHIDILSKEPRGEDQVELTVRIGKPSVDQPPEEPSTLTAVKEWGNWRLVPAQSVLDRLKKWKASLGKQKALIEDIAGRVSQGAYRSRADALRPILEQYAEDTVKDFMAAAQAGDVEALLDTIARDPRREIREFLAYIQDIGKVQEALDAALDSRFGKGPTASPRMDDAVKDWLSKNFGRIDILAKEPKGEDRVDLTVRFAGADTKDSAGPPRSLAAVKEGKDWKLVPPDDVMKKLAAAKPFLARYKTKVQQITQQINEGNYRSRAEATQALVLDHFLIKSLLGN